MQTLKDVLNRLPKHLHQFVVDQKYENYTAVDHAVWRYIMRLSFRFLSENAHQSYVDGLIKTGIGIEKIPNVVEMNEILSKIGWGAVCVDGFIPPTAFMEFQSYNVLVIAADMRNMNHIEYTPAPDIVHEAAGHAPIIVDSEYAEYLRLFGEIGSKAISSKKDNDLYEAIRKLSILKENTYSNLKDIENAEQDIVRIQNDMGPASEMAKIRNLHWWTVEYGLIGSLENPQIYGAGLLSSIGESQTCLTSLVSKIPYNINAADSGFDITTKQPHLFVTPSFSHLTVVLNEFADTMALRKGGYDSVLKAINSHDLATCELSSGLQISGVFTEVIKDSKGNTAYIQTTGPSMLCERERMLIGHGVDYHSEGYGTAIGKLKDCNELLEEMTLSQLKDIGLIIGKKVQLNFESGVVVKGKLHYVRKNRYGKILLMTFKECTVTQFDKVLFEPQWGDYDMGVGYKISSVFAGAADHEQFNNEPYISPTTTIQLEPVYEQFQGIFRSLRYIREYRGGYENLDSIFNDAKQKYPDEWLIYLEIFEIASHRQKYISLQKVVKDYLINLIDNQPKYRKLVLDGINLVEDN
ncbi:MAG: aromatic amino acid hydroxylase [Bacteroidales bacterium]|nr:aromatic amino acid hydroxylase [Bacteroidales bacterium]